MPSNLIAFIGLGAMGAPMARNLIASGFALTLFNRSRARAEALRSPGVAVADSPREAVTPGGIVVMMLANDAALEAVTLGNDGVTARLGQGGLRWVADVE
jgi:3-hydroxyisobutyrate dehydrogenase-like beta-hydroxyacid dehydrogenase